MKGRKTEFLFEGMQEAQQVYKGRLRTPRKMNGQCANDVFLYKRASKKLILIKASYQMGKSA